MFYNCLHLFEDIIPIYFNEYEYGNGFCFGDTAGGGGITSGNYWSYSLFDLFVRINGNGSCEFSSATIYKTLE
jgi:hypothetical protein